MLNENRIASENSNSSSVLPPKRTKQYQDPLDSLSSLDERSLGFRQHIIVHRAVGELVDLQLQNGKIRRCIDLSSAYGSVNFGHCNPACLPKRFSSDLVAGAIAPEGEQLARWLLKSLELQESRVLFQVGGAQAVSTALAICQRARPGKIASIAGAFHGLSLEALTVTPEHHRQALQATSLLNDLSMRPVSINPNRPIHEQHIPWSDLSCIVFEPIQGANGYCPLPELWLKTLTNAAREHGVLLVADEIQSGYFRHGALSVCKSLNIHPDIYLFGKSITNGFYPLSAVILSERLEAQCRMPGALAHTFQGATPGLMAALKVATYIEQQPILQWCQVVGETLQEFRKELNHKSLAKEIYQTGPTLSFEPLRLNARQLADLALPRGVLVITGGKSSERLRIAPPLNIKLPNLKSALHILKDLIIKGS